MRELELDAQQGWYEEYGNAYAEAKPEPGGAHSKEDRLQAMEMRLEARIDSLERRLAEKLDARQVNENSDNARYAIGSSCERQSAERMHAKPRDNHDALQSQPARQQCHREGTGEQAFQPVRHFVTVAEEEQHGPKSNSTENAWQEFLTGGTERHQVRYPKAVEKEYWRSIAASTVPTGAGVLHRLNMPDESNTLSQTDALLSDKIAELQRRLNSTERSSQIHKAVEYAHASTKLVNSIDCTLSSIARRLEHAASCCSGSVTLNAIRL